MMTKNNYNLGEPRLYKAWLESLVYLMLLVLMGYCIKELS